jgi:hypothetical protein
MDGMRVIFVDGLGGPYLDVVGYDDWSRPVGRVIYRGQLPATSWDWVEDTDGMRWLAYELLNVADVIDVTGSR